MSELLLVFGLGLLLAVLTSALASRSPLSGSAVFLLVGLVAGPLVLNVIHLPAGVVERVAEVALFTILFTDGQQAPWSVVRRQWRTPARALVVGMPATFLLVAAAGHWLAGLDWAPALVLGAVLAPTDPVFASALVGRQDVPRRVRNLLNIESGVNDGLALPAVLLLASLAGGRLDDWGSQPLVLLGELALGVALGIVLPVVVWLVIRIPGVGTVTSLRPLGPLAIAVLLFATCELLHANQFLAAFVAGAVIATLAPTASDAFRHSGELVSEVVKGLALVAFASLIERDLITDAGWAGLVTAVSVILLARPVPILCVLVGTDMPAAERLSVAWFGPKGFASVAYAVIVAFSGMPGAYDVLAITTLTVLLSIVAHSSTDVAVAKWLRRADAAETAESDATR